LIKLLSNPNVWWRRQAQRVFNEKFEPGLVPQLQKMALDTSDATPAHVHALWLLVSQHELEPSFHLKVLESTDEATRNWGVRGAGEMQTISQPVYEKIKAMAHDPSPDVRVQVTVAAGRLTEPDGLPILLAMLGNPENVNDPLIPTIIYNNLLPMVPRRGGEIVGDIEKDPAIQKNFDESVVRWVRDAVNALNRTPQQIVASLKDSLPGNVQGLNNKNEAKKVQSALQGVLDAFASLGVKPADAGNLFDPPLREKIGEIAGSNTPSRTPATVIALWWNDAKAIKTARAIIADPKAPAGTRSQFVIALGEEKNPANVEAFASLVSDPNAPILIRQAAVNALGEMNDPTAAHALIYQFDQLPPDLRPMAINALVLSKEAASELLNAIRDKKIPLTNMNENHARAINGFNDPALSKEVADVWGRVQTERNPERAKLAIEYKKLFLSRGGDAVKGMAVFTAKCAQCHTIYGKGGNIGPDLTGVGRDNLDLVLSNLLDPSLVIGKPYYVYVAKLKDDTSFSGLLVEDSPKQIVLKEPTGTHVIPRDQLVKLVQQNISMMPEGLEQTMSKDEFCDLISFLLTKQPPK
jgi:putative heme-binding domain-containing protein